MLKDDAMLNFTVTDTLDNIPQNTWDRLFGYDLIESYGYHKTLHEAKLNEFATYYLIGKRNDATVAIIPFFTMEFSFTTLIRGPLQRIVFGIRKFYKNFLTMKIVFIGSPTTESFHIGVAETENKNCIIDHAYKKIETFSRTHHINTILFYNLTNADQSLMKHLLNNGFAGMEDFPGARLEIQAKSLDEYIAHLGSSTRKDIRRKLRKSTQAAVLETEIRETVDGIIDDLYKLYLNNFNESDIHFEILTPEFFTKLCHNMPGIVKCFVTRHNGKIVAFNMCFVKGNFCIDKFIGLDYTVALQYNLYYTTICYNIDWCIKNGIRYYQPGQGDYDAKIRLGAKLIPLYIFIKSFNPLLNFFMKPIIQLTQPKNFDPALKNLAKYRKEVFLREG
ncbi:MAG: GNAT family N-acetyltransferase [Candidatus Omnitrophota bacterium]